MNIKLEHYIVCHATVEQLVPIGYHNSMSFFRMKTRPLVGEVIRIYNDEWLTVEGNKDTDFVKNIKDELTPGKTDLKFKVREIQHEVGAGCDLSLVLKYIED